MFDLVTFFAMLATHGMLMETNPVILMLGPTAPAAKLGLVAYIAWASKYLGRYRGPVLGAAIVTGIFGGANNLSVAFS
ncbi:MAG TPA: hypothetical protein VFO05_05010 [Candidatus Limnocylindrales bacterium]|nr:hypothetical protein [Candidatus Limnocylindrales bacterium]